MEPVAVAVTDLDGTVHRARWRGGPEQRCGPWTVLARISADVNGGRLEWGLVAARPRRAERVSVRLAGHQLGARTVHREGWQSWSPTGPRLERRPARCPAWAARSIDGGAARPRGWSESVAVVGGPDGAVAVGFLSAARAFGRIGPASPAGWGLACRAELDGIAVGPSPRPLDALGWTRGETVGAALAAYADAVAREAGARAQAPAVTGWCSWYAHGPDVTAGLIRRTVGVLQDWRDCLRILQLDDGIQAAVGDWLETGAQVGAPLPALLELIRAGGFTPGLWLAPFAAARHSRLAREHPTWLLRGRTGAPAVCMPWMDDAAALDLSQPAAVEHVRLTAARLRTLGAGYVKADFCFAGAVAGRRNPAWTRAAALRAGLEALRAGLGHDVHLAVCGCPWLTAVGVADSCRVAADVDRRWRPRGDRTVPVPQGGSAPAARNAVVGSLRRAWMHRRLWANDPDCWLRAGLPAPVRDTLGEVAATAGAVLMLSDPAERLADADHEATLGTLARLARLDGPLVPAWGTAGGHLRFQRTGGGGALALTVDLRRGGSRVEGAQGQAGPPGGGRG